MKEEYKEKQSQKETNYNPLLWEKNKIDSNIKDYGQSKDKNKKILFSQESSNKISNPTVIFNYKGKLTYIQCTIKDNMKNICQRFAFEINENKNKLCFKFNDNIINDKLKFEELVDNSNNYINIIVEEIIKRDIFDSENKNYIS